MGQFGMHLLPGAAPPLPLRGGGGAPGNACKVNGAKWDWGGKHSDPSTGLTPETGKQRMQSRAESISVCKASLNRRLHQSTQRSGAKTSPIG